MNHDSRRLAHLMIGCHRSRYAETCAAHPHRSAEYRRPVAPVRGVDYPPSHMDWNTLLIWLSGISSIMTLVRMVKGPNRQTGWIISCLLVLIVLGGAYVLNPNIAGFAGGAAWGLF